ncbi:terminase [Pseudonocardia sp. N23]|uniref:terminase n=1 Tax=Pseudonocardia sp. N23 TaxID=1987376 RepID=UPI000BFD62D3|nr:terminase [Pseudonocardia sp. N23]GAY12045.1 phage terminase, large subunit [Pseudonocardia sp. N23]
MLEPLDTLPAGIPDRTLGWGVLAWAAGAQHGEPLFYVPDGELAGQPLTLTDYQIRFVLWWYALDERARWLYRAALVRLARGTIKSPTAGFLSLAELLGPVRFGGWDADVPGGALGRPVSMPLVQLSAVSQAQVGNTFKYVGAWTARGTPLQRIYNLDPGRERIYVPSSPGITGGELRVTTSSPATARGGRPTFVVADELSEWTVSNHGHEFYDVLSDNATKVPGARVLGLANAPEPGSGSVAEALWEAWSAEQEGRTRGRQRLLMVVREAPTDTDWSDPESIRAALATIYHDCPWVDQEQILEQVLDPKRPIERSQREFGNWRVSSYSTWVAAQAYDACADPGVVVEDGEEIALGLDPSESDDATALVACRISDGFSWPIWIHEPRHAGAPVDVAELDYWVTQAHERYRVCALWSDVRPMEQLVRVEWPGRWGAGYDAPATPASQGSPSDPIAFDMRRHIYRFALGAELVASEIEQGTLLHSGDRVMARHVYSAWRRPYRDRISIGKGPDRDRKVDAAVSLVIARMARRAVLESKSYRKRHRSRAVVILG